MVARVTLHNMRQDRDEPVHTYGASLRGQAGVCKFTQQCTGCDANVDYTEAILRDVLCRGLEDSDGPFGKQKSGHDPGRGPQICGSQGGGEKVSC